MKKLLFMILISSALISSQAFAGLLNDSKPVGKPCKAVDGGECNEGTENCKCI